MSKQGYFRRVIFPIFLVMGVMIIPFVSSLSDDVINAVPQAMRDGAYALGATQSETIKQVIVPAALPGIVGSVLLAVSRAIGETMIVVMAAGLSANLTAKARSTPRLKTKSRLDKASTRKNSANKFFDALAAARPEERPVFFLLGDGEVGAISV